MKIDSDRDKIGVVQSLAIPAQANHHHQYISDLTYVKLFADFLNFSIRTGNLTP